VGGDMSQQAFYEQVQRREEWEAEHEQGSAVTRDDGTTRKSTNGNQESTTDEGEAAAWHRSPERCWQDV
jgi:hypothetical protein